MFLKKFTDYLLSRTDKSEKQNVLNPATAVDAPSMLPWYSAKNLSRAIIFDHTAHLNTSLAKTSTANILDEEASREESDALKKWESRAGPWTQK